mmetsp:Transcript_7385/g.15965  ORF Transcript_7385/g.15965 Transcript_7385/m.15965 type:complete len:202 (+) Transcript_7385:296-901(+)
MFYDQLVFALFVSTSLILTANAAPFGMKSKGTENDNLSTNNEHDDYDPLVDMSDEELLGVMEEFALMSEEEMEEAFMEVVEMLGGDENSEMATAVREIMDAVKSMDVSDGLAPLMESMGMSIEEEIAEATHIALEMISNSDWERIYNKRGEILESLVIGGNISAEDAALYKNDDGAWVKELRFIWDELQTQARESAKSNEL